MAIPRSARGRDDDMPVYGGSGGGKDKKKKKPIGVPEDYTTPYERPHATLFDRARHNSGNIFGRGAGKSSPYDRARAGVSQMFGAGPTGAIGERRPRYYAGDEWAPASLGPAAIGELQAMMAAGGLIGGDFRYGVWDSDTAKAYKALLTEANAQGLTAEQALQLRASSFSASGGGGGSGSGGGSGGGGSWQIGPDGQPVFVEEQYVPPPLELRTTNKDDLRRVFRAAVIDTMGQGWSQEQINEVVDAYNWKEIQVQKDAYDQQVALERAEFMGERAEGGEVISSVEMASPETFLDQQLQERDPVGYQTGKAVNEVIPDFWQMMQGWS